MNFAWACLGLPCLALSLVLLVPLSLLVLVLAWLVLLLPLSLLVLVLAWLVLGFASASSVFALVGTRRS